MNPLGERARGILALSSLQRESTFRTCFILFNHERICSDNDELFPESKREERIREPMNHLGEIEKR